MKAEDPHVSVSAIPSSAASATVSSAVADAGPSSQRATEQGALARLLRTYTADLQRGQLPSQLTSLAKQITDAAKALGQTVTLPKPPAPSEPSGDSVSVPAASPAPQGKLGVTV